MDRRVIVFRTRLRPGVDPEYGQHAEQMWRLASSHAGYVSATDFVADDGERLALIEWDSPGNLAIWRDDVEHLAAQSDGRAKYYARYSLQVCSELKVSRFDAESGEHTRSDRDPAVLRAIAECWLHAFEHRELDALLALYADGATHTSPKIRARHPETGGLLRGKDAMRAWWQDSFDRLPAMKYEEAVLTADARRVYMEYVRRVPGEPDMPVAEVLDIEHGKIVASRVFHG